MIVQKAYNLRTFKEDHIGENTKVELDNRDREQLLHILIQARRLTKIAFVTKAISSSEQDIILREIHQATSILKDDHILSQSA